MSYIQTLTNGQHILFGMVLSKLTNELNSVVANKKLEDLAGLIQELDKPDNYDTDLTPSEAVEEHLDKAYDIFCDFWEENQSYFVFFGEKPLSL
jgi:hypothetical protein